MIFVGFLLVALTWNAEDLIPPSERFIFNFNSKEELKKWHLYSDSEYGGACLLNFDGFVACVLSCYEHLAYDLKKVTVIQMSRDSVCRSFSYVYDFDTWPEFIII